MTPKRIYGTVGAWDYGYARRFDFVNSGLLYSAVYGATGTGTRFEFGT